MQGFSICDDVGRGGVLQMKRQHKNKNTKFSAYEQIKKSHLSNERGQTTLKIPGRVLLQTGGGSKGGVQQKK